MYPVIHTREAMYTLWYRGGYVHPMVPGRHAGIYTREACWVYTPGRLCWCTPPYVQGVPWWVYSSLCTGCTMVGIHPLSLCTTLPPWVYPTLHHAARCTAVHVRAVYRCPTMMLWAQKRRNPWVRGLPEG